VRDRVHPNETHQQQRKGKEVARKLIIKVSIKDTKNAEWEGLNQEKHEAYLG